MMDKTPLSLAVRLGLEATPINLTNDIAIAMFELRRGAYFTNRAINVWNTLPADRIDFSSFAAFKQTVQQFELSTFLLCY